MKAFRLTWVVLILIAGFVRLHAADSPSPSTPDWSDTITEVLRFTAKAEEGNVQLEVELEKPDEAALKKQTAADGAVTGYSLKGRKLPERFWPGCNLITKFELVWDGKRMEIPARFWNDLAGFHIGASSLDLAKVPVEHRYEAQKFLEALVQPHVILSADGNTVLIEWERGEECDGHSTIRWIISKSGTVLRHRHTPPHEC